MTITPIMHTVYYIHRSEIDCHVLLQRVAVLFLELLEISDYLDVSALCTVLEERLMSIQDCALAAADSN